MNKKLFRTLLVSILFMCVYFINIDGVKACKCYYTTGWFEYASSANTNGSNSSSQMQAIAIIKYTANSADVVNSCVGMRTYSQGSNAYQPGKNMLYVESFDKCTLKDFDRGNPFNVDSKSISDNKCSVDSCESAELYYYFGGKGEIQTKSGTFNHKFVAKTKKEHESIIAEDEKTKSDEKGVEDIDISAVKANDTGIEKAKAGTSNCDLIPPTIMSFLKNLFLLIQVIGIVLLIVMSMIEFIKAITASSEDGLVGAVKNTYRRIIIVVVLLLLPMFVIWILNIVNANAYKTGDDGKRIIGTDGNPLCKW